MKFRIVFQISILDIIKWNIYISRKMARFRLYICYLSRATFSTPHALIIFVQSWSFCINPFSLGDGKKRRKRNIFICEIPSKIAKSGWNSIHSSTIVILNDEVEYRLGEEKKKFDALTEMRLTFEWSIKNLILVRNDVFPFYSHF